MRHLSSLLFALGLSALLVGSVFGQDTGQPGQGKVYVLPTTGVVDQVMSGYLREGIAKAHREGAQAVVIRLHTPGGMLDATREIVSTLLDAPLPTIVWVAPSGSHAASAGMFITIASHVAVMAPGTNIGAATPVASGGEDIPEDLARKVMEDTQALVRGIQELRPQRNVDWAITTVVDARSYSAAEAVAEGGVDGVAATLQDVLAFADGRTAIVSGQEVTIDVAGATTEELAMNPLQAFLHLLSDPNIAFILFTVGFYGLIFELQNPNFVTGILGGISIILAFIGFGSLPLNVGGLLLIALAIVLFILELSVVSHGLLTIAGIVCFALGAAALYTEPGTPTAPDISVAVEVIVTMTLLTGIFMALIVFAAVRNRRMVATPGTVGATLTGELLGEVRRPLNPIGSVYAAGEEWTARAADERTLGRGTAVKIVRQEGLTLVVEPDDPSRSPA
jgi:membrane-bound serine protease (ClpP class)